MEKQNQSANLKPEIISLKNEVVSVTPNATKCTNCPYIKKDKYTERVQRINVINACRSQNKLK